MPEEQQKDDLDSLQEPWLTDDQAPENFNWHWRKVVEGLMNGKYIYEAYAEAYDLDINDEAKKRVAWANGSRLLRNAKFKQLWRRQLEETGFNDEVADTRLADLITNPATSDRDRNAALKHYNELRGRLIRRTDLTTDGKAIELPVIISPITPRNATTETETTTSP